MHEPPVARSPEDVADRIPWTSCPGCGLHLPDGSSELDARTHASAACWMLYGEVQGHELDDLARLGQHHQLLVDAYGAQHIGPATPGIRSSFSLIGLELSLVEGWTGIAIRDAHQRLAARFRTWPTFEPPTHRAGLTVFDIAAAETPGEYELILRRWAEAVWATWASRHQQVRKLVDERLRSDIP